MVKWLKKNFNDNNQIFQQKEKWKRVFKIYANSHLCGKDFKRRHYSVYSCCRHKYFYCSRHCFNWCRPVVNLLLLRHQCLTQWFGQVTWLPCSVHQEVHHRKHHAKIYMKLWERLPIKEVIGRDSRYFEQPLTWSRPPNHIETSSCFLTEWFMRTETRQDVFNWCWHHCL